MKRPFYLATAEQVVTVVEAVVVHQVATPIEFVAEFSDIPKDRAESALKLAMDIGLLSNQPTGYSALNALCRFVVTPNQMQKAAVLRIMLESYQPFITFRERLIATE